MVKFRVTAKIAWIGHFTIAIRISAILLLALNACVVPKSTTTPNQTATASTPHWQQLPQQVINNTRFRHYATVGRTDGSTRHMLIDEATLQRWQPGQPLPPNALIVMQTWLIPGTESTSFTKHMQADGTFSYGSFAPAQPGFTTGADNNCASCHEVSADDPGTFTLPMLNAAVAQGRPMTSQCNRAGRIPCEDEVYRNFVPAQ